MRDTLKFIILTAIFATPFICLYVAQGMFFPFITGKNFTFRILVEVMLGAWMLLMFLDASYRPRFTWVLGAATAFLAVITLADLFGANPYKSFWSNYERMEGLIAHAHLFLYFLIAGTVLQHERLWTWFWRTSLGVSMIVAIHAFSQLAGSADIHQSADRLDATFGNATYLAVYALFHMGIAIFFYVRDGARNSLRWLYLVIAAVNFIVLYYTQTRGALLGVIGGAFLALLLVALFDRERREWRKYAAVGMLGLVALIAAFFVFKDSEFVKNQPTLQRMATISLEDATTQARFNIWKMSWEGFKERPILGWGQDNFLYVFSKHYIPAMWKQEPWFDRSHDVFFDWLIAGGALGLLAYLSMFAAALWYIWFGRKKVFSVPERAILTGILAGYFIHNIFVFDNLTSYIVFFGILAYIHALHTEEPETTHSHQHKKKGNDGELEGADLVIAAAVALALTAGLVYFANIRNIQANLALISAIRPETALLDDGKGGKTIAMKEVLDRGLFGSIEALEQLLQMAITTADPRVPPDISKQFYELTAAEVEKVLARDPENLRIRSFAAMFYGRFGQYERAREHFEKAIALSPRRQSTYLDYAMLEIANRNYAHAEELARTAFELDTRNPDARTIYSAALIYSGKFTQADEVSGGFDEYSRQRRYDSRIVNAYGNMGQYDQVVTLINEKIARGEALARDWLALGGSLLELGKRAEGEEALKKAVELDASLKAQVDQVLGATR